MLYDFTMVVISMKYGTQMCKVLYTVVCNEKAINILKFDYKFILLKLGNILGCIMQIRIYSFCFVR